MKAYNLYLKIVNIRDRNHSIKGYSIKGHIAQAVLNIWSKCNEIKYRFTNKLECDNE